MEGGTLVFHAAGGAAVGLLLPDGFDADAPGRGGGRSPPAARWRAPAAAARRAGAGADAGSIAGVGRAASGLRLAYQLERIARCAGDRRGARSHAEHPRRAPRLPRSASSACRAAATGGCSTRCVPPRSASSPASPRGEVASDQHRGRPARRRRGRPAAAPGTVLVLPIQVGDEAVGAVALWLRSGPRADRRRRAPSCPEALSQRGPASWSPGARGRPAQGPRDGRIR